MEELKGERKWTRNIKNVLEQDLKKDDDFKKYNYRITCDTENNDRITAVISLNKYLKAFNDNSKTDVSVKDFANNQFHPDILIEEEIRTKDSSYFIPRVMIECKYNGSSATPHEILAYNYKADLHKKLYSGLRYGLLIANASYIQKTTIKFGNNFDFILALEEKPTDDEINKLVSIIKDNFKCSRELENILDSSSKKNNTLCVSIENRLTFKNVEE